MYKKKSHLFFYLSILTIFFILIQISFLIQWSEFYLGDYVLIAKHINIPLVVVPGIFLFVIYQLLLHVIFLLVIWYFSILIGQTLKLSSSRLEILGIGIWFLSMTTILLANYYLYPNSKFAKCLSWYLSPSIIEIIMLISSALVIVALFAAIYGCNKKIKLSLLVIGMIASSGLYFNGHKNIPTVHHSNKPDIIVIGIDSLRPDFITFFGGKNSTPAIDEFLRKAAVFNDAYTPLARTYPSWVSILTGEYPMQNGIRFNLSSVKPDYAHMLPKMLQQQGYKTFFATDETRFSNITPSFGFDQVIAPPVGFNDFMLGTMNDFPLSNLLVNTPIGKYFFPNSYANRAVFSLYDPDLFLNQLAAAIKKEKNRPLFLAVHFCLPHFPYFWGREQASDSSLTNYQSALKRVDKQFNDFLQILKENKLLEHSILVLLSDHGEAFELPGDRITAANYFIAGKNNTKKIIPRFYPPSVDDERVNQSAGHGTDVLGLSQYRTLLAFRLFGLEENEKKRFNERVSLLAIKPTLLDLAQGTHSTNSLKSDILDGKEKSVQNDLYIESDFAPQAIHSVHPETRKLLFQGIDFFQINSANGSISVKPYMVDLIISSKQYAVFKGPWVLALYPKEKGQRIPILINLKSHYWTNDLTTDFANASPAAEMLNKLKRFYGLK